MKHTVLIQVTDKSNEDKSLCGPCGGACCKTFPGRVFPLDLSPTNNENEIFEKTYQAVKSGRYVIDHSDLDLTPYQDRATWETVTFLRPARGTEVNQIRGMYTFFETSPCNFLTDTGCELPFQSRPGECRGLVPRVNDNYERNCRHLDRSLSKDAALRAWRELEELLDVVEELVEESQKG